MNFSGGFVNAVGEDSKKLMLEVNGLCKSFGGLVAIKDLDISVSKGEIVGFIGPNGSGKTTFFNVLSGFYKPEKGTIVFDGKNIAGLKPYRICQLGVSRTFQLTRSFDQMTTLQNAMIGRMYGSQPIYSMRQAMEECEGILEFVDLGKKASTYASNLGIVQRKKVEIARALATKPKLLLLDEMMSGLTPAEMQEALRLVKAIADSGITLIVVEHVIKAILDISSKLIVINYGEKIAEGDPQDVIKNRKVIDAYLGE